MIKVVTLLALVATAFAAIDHADIWDAVDHPLSGFQCTEGSTLGECVQQLKEALGGLRKFVLERLDGRRGAPPARLLRGLPRPLKCLLKQAKHEQQQQQQQQDEEAADAEERREYSRGPLGRLAGLRTEKKGTDGGLPRHLGLGRPDRRNGTDEERNETRNDHWEHSDNLRRHILSRGQLGLTDFDIQEVFEGESESQGGNQGESQSESQSESQGESEGESEGESGSLGEGSGGDIADEINDEVPTTAEVQLLGGGRGLAPFSGHHEGGDRRRGGDHDGSGENEEPGSGGRGGSPRGRNRPRE